MKRTLFALTAVTLFALAACGDSNAPSVSGAEVACEQRVEERLKSPSSADFNGTTAEAVTDTEYKVSGTVDAENSFGAALRSEFECTIRFENDGVYARVDSFE